MSSCAVVGYDPKRVEPISGQHTLAGYRQSYLWGLSLAVWDTSPQSMEREFGVRIKPAESFYGSLAKTFLEMPTTLRQMLRRTFWRLRYSRKSRGVCFGVCGYSRKSRGVCFGVCGYSRKSRGVCLGVCGYSRKSRGVCFGVCGYSRKSRGVCLGVCGYSRKSRGICFGVCGSSANRKNHFSPLAPPVQAFPKTFWL